VLDEVQIHLVPVLLGCGRRLFDVLSAETELEIIRVIDTPEATHLGTGSGPPPGSAKQPRTFLQSGHPNRSGGTRTALAICAVNWKA
jgi:hypothetical protein